MPVVDMVRLDHADPPSAVPESASAVSYCQRNALCPCVEAPSSTDIERVAKRVNIHLLESVYTDVAFNRGSRDRVALPEDPPSPCGRVKLVTHHNNLDRRTVPTEKLCGIREGPCTQQVEKGVASQFLRGAFVALHHLGFSLTCGVDESRPAQLGRHRPLVQVRHVAGRLRVKEPGQSRHPVGLHHYAQRAARDPMALTIGDTTGIELIAKRTGTSKEKVGIRDLPRRHTVLTHFITHSLDGGAKFIRTHAITRVTKAAPYRRGVLGAELTGGDHRNDRQHPGR